MKVVDDVFDGLVNFMDVMYEIHQITVFRSYLWLEDAYKEI